MSSQTAHRPNSLDFMTRDIPPAVEGQPPRFHRQNNSDADTLLSLWEEVPFARLPQDAPKELSQYIIDIENPKRVYAIHRASRRHNFQLLVEKYISQLRYGCDSPVCPTPTCFSFRKRHVGKAPIRRYNTTSARTLATYLSSQDNPENGLCPHLSSPKVPPAAVNSLIFESKRTLRDHVSQKDSSELKGRSKPGVEARGSTPSLHLQAKNEDGKQEKRQPAVDAIADPPASAFTIREHLPSKDYRSFAANVFGTVAFKMLEWLTPNGIATMTEKVQELQTKTSQDTLGAPSQTPLNMTEQIVPLPNTPSRPHQSCLQHGHEAETPTKNPFKKTSLPEKLATVSKPSPVLKDGSKEPTLDMPHEPLVEWGSGLPPKAIPPISTHRPDRQSSQPRNPSARVRTSSTSNPKRKVSIDAFPSGTGEVLTGLRSPRVTPGNKPEKVTKPFMTTTTPATITRSLTQLSAEELLQRTSTSLEPVLIAQKTDMPLVKEGSAWPSPNANNVPQSPDKSSQGASKSATESGDTTSEPDVDILPQSLSRLSLEIVDLLCDILQEDGTSERHLLEPSSIRRYHSRSNSVAKALRRRRSARRDYPLAMKRQWKMFIEQSLYNVLSDPYAILNSFTTEAGLLDSQSLWYCMLRITRVAPSLALDSLWQASSSLFAPPKRLQSLCSPTMRLFRIPERSLTSEEASRLMAVCLHALVATVPVVEDATEMFEISRLRSRGVSVDNAGPSSPSMTALCLQYDDAFSDDLTFRLARRLFSAISTQRGFKELVNIDRNLESDKPEMDVLDTILSQLESITEDSSSSSSVILTHSQREAHEKRVPTLLLDWARTVMLREWDGKPTVNATGPFGGALALISAMYQRRTAFHIGDVDFRSEYFSDRLDSIEMPIVWLAQSSTKQRRHLLDHPYIFSPSTLVSYFRAINFSRMNRSYEESSSLLNRMRHIMQQGSLISNNAHKDFLSDMLKTASCQYLILEIRRRDPLKDAFDQLWRREERELLRPLKVHLGEDTGEEGFDSGGVQQEFFRLVIAQALDPAYGLFAVDDRTRMAWFRPGGIEAEWKYELVGLIISLAVYNGLTLPVTFPKALYRKLLGEPVTDIHHIADGWPDLANGLTTLLEWDENDGVVEDVFARTYEFSVETFGVHVSREMVPDDMSTGTAKELKWPQWNSPIAPPTTDNPDDAPMVTGGNRNAYVSDYVRYLSHISVAQQYRAFERGFRAVLHPKSLSLLSPSLLQNLVEGTQTIDISELRRYARYVGWDASHRTVRDFWSIVKRYDDSAKRKLLEFVTASDRVPVGGMRNMQFVIQKNGVIQEEGGHLPTAYTCYGTLLLPEYKDKEVLRERLGMALENAQGFGFA